MFLHVRLIKALMFVAHWRTLTKKNNLETDWRVTVLPDAHAAMDPPQHTHKIALALSRRKNAPLPHTHNTPTHTGQARSAAANQDTRANGQRAHVARRVSGARTRRGQGACYGWTSLGHPCRPYLTPPCPPPGTRCVLCVIERGRTSVAKITHIVPL